MKLKVVWISAKQKDDRYSALVTNESEPIPGIIQQDKGFVRGSKKFKLNSVIDVPSNMIAVVEDNEWKFKERA